MAKFNLLEEPWIPVLKGGVVREVSLSEALLEAHTIARIETPSPLEEAVLHRLLLAVLYRVLNGVRGGCDALELLERGEFPRDALEAYLEGIRNCFYLFHDEYPFYQVPDLQNNCRPIPWTELLPHAAKGNNPTLFDHTTTDRFPKADYSTATRALLVHQHFDLPGRIPGLPKGSAQASPLASRAIFLPVSSTLFATLALNLVPYKPKDDAPLWEQPQLSAIQLANLQYKTPLTGITKVYTWMSRAVLLLDAGDAVTHICHGPGMEPIEAGFRDPMVAYRLGGEGQVLPLRLSVEKSFWRDFSAMLPAAGGSFPATLAHAVRVAEEMGLRLELRVLGQVSDQAKVLDVRREVYPLPQGFLSLEAEELLQKALELAERVGNALYGVAREVAKGVLGDKDQEELRRFQDSLPLLRLYWAALDGRFPRFLEGLAQPDAMDRWREEVRQAALRAWEETRAFVGTEGRHLKGLAVGERAMGLALTHAQAREGRP